MLLCRSCNDVRLTRVLDDRGARYPDLPFGGYDTAASVAEAIAIGGYGDRRVRLYVIPNENIGCTRIVNIQHQHHRRRLRTVVDQLLAYPDLHHSPPWYRGRSVATTREAPLHPILVPPAP